MIKNRSKLLHNKTERARGQESYPKKWVIKPAVTALKTGSCSKSCTIFPFDYFY